MPGKTMPGKFDGLQDRFARALNRIAADTAIGRVRADELDRAANHGREGVLERMEAAVLRLEAIADEMDTALGTNGR